MRYQFRKWPSISTGCLIVHDLKIIAVPILQPYNTQAPALVAFVDEVKRGGHFLSGVLKQHKVFARLFCYKPVRHVGRRAPAAELNYFLHHNLRSSHTANALSAINPSNHAGHQYHHGRG